MMELLTIHTIIIITLRCKINRIEENAVIESSIQLVVYRRPLEVELSADT